MKEGTQYYFYHNDHLGTPQKLTAVNGAVVWSATYSSFGEASIEVETVENPLRFPGQIFDEETGLHWNLWRYYDPNIGRYLRTDPIGLLGGNNPFAYVSNNPITGSDPFGLSECYNYSIVSVESIKAKVLSKSGKCPWSWALQKGLEMNKDQFIGEQLSKNCEKECKTGSCKNKKDIKDKTRALSDVFTETFWWKGFSATLDEAEGVSKGWKKCTMTVRIEGTGVVDGWEGTCECE